MALAPVAPKRRGPRTKDETGRPKVETHPRQIAVRCTLETFDRVAALRLALNADNTVVLERAVDALVTTLRGTQKKDFEFAIERAKRLRK